MSMSAILERYQYNPGTKCMCNVKCESSQNEDECSFEQIHNEILCLWFYICSSAPREKYMTLFIVDWQ